MLNIGYKSGRLTVIRLYGKTKDWKRRRLCHCECGETAIVTERWLKTQHTQSCGCLQKERASQANTTHGYSRRTRVYGIWTGMMNRCHRSTTSGYHKYGARGIHVCERWHAFENFLADMGEPPAGHSIEREDNNGNYEPGNCKWATLLEQANNKRTSRFLEHDGQRLTLAQWARRTGIREGTIDNRLHLGWSVDKALSTPVRSWHNAETIETILMGLER